MVSSKPPLRPYCRYCFAKQGDLRSPYEPGRFDRECQQLLWQPWQATSSSTILSSILQFDPSVRSLGSIPQFDPSVRSLGSIPRLDPSARSLGLIPRLDPSARSLSSIPQLDPSARARIGERYRGIRSYFPRNGPP